MAEKKRTSDSSEDKVLDDMTNDFDDVFSEIKDKNDVESKKNQLEEESAIRGIFGRIKKKNSNQKNSLSETEKKTSSMNLSDSQEILDLSKEVTDSAKEEAVVVVKAEEESNGVTTITMKIPKITDEKLAEIIAEQKQADMTKKKVEDKPKEDVQTEKKSSETKNQDLNSEVDDIANTQKQAEHKIELKEKENEFSEDLSQGADEKPSFKSKFSKFLSTAKEKALYYLGFEDDEEYDDDVIFSTSSGVERLKNANPLDFDEEYKENIVYQAPDDEKKDNKPDLLKIAAQNTTINTDFNLTEDKSKETKIESEEKPVKTETKSEVEGKPVEAETKSEVEEKPVEAETKSEVEEKTVETETKSEVEEKPVETETKSEVEEKPVETETKSEIDKKPITAEIKSDTKVYKKKTDDELTFDEILAEEKRNRISIDIALDDDESNEDISNSPLSDQLDFSVLSEQIAGDALREPRRSKKPKTEKPIKSEETAKSVEEETKEETTKPAEIEIKSAEDDINFESVAKQIMADTKVEKTVSKPIQSEVKNDDFDFDSPFIQIIDMPVKKHIEEKAEPVKQEVAEEKTEPVEQAVAEEKTEPVEQAVVEKKAEPVEQAVAEEKAEPVKQAVAEEKAEPVKQAVVEEKTEPVKQAVVEEKTEDSENPFVRIVDRVKPKQKSSEPVVQQKQFNPIIIEDEKLIQEFKLDFAKDNIPKTLLTYSRPSEKNNFVVMAGKFTKTVRSEYRAYKYKPKSPEPPTPPDDKQNPPRSEQSKQLEQKKKNDESGKTSVFGEFSFKKLKKNPEPEQKATAKVESEQKAQPQQEQKHTSVVKPIHKQEVQQTKAEETHKVKIPKPKMPTVPPAVKMAVPSFIRKKQRPEIMPDIKEKKEAVQPEPEKTAKPKTEKKKNNKASEAKKAIKKKTQMLKLFSDDEDFDIDDIDSNGENREIEEYSSKNDEREIRSEINNNYRKLTFRSIIVAIGLVFSITLDILVGVISETFMSMPFGWLLVAFLNAIILCVCVVACYVPIINGLIPLRHFKANSDTSLAVASFAGILQAFVSFFSPQSFINGYLHYYTTLVILGLLLNCIGRMLIITRVHDNFKFIMKNPELYAGKIYTDERNAKRMFMGAPLNKPLIAYRKKTKFLSNFLQLSYAPDPSENIASKIAPITSVVAIVAALFYAFIGGGVAEGASAFALFAIILTPVCQLVAVNLPIKKLCSAVVKKGSMVTSYESVKQFCDTNAIIVDANDLYPSGTVTMSGIKTFSGSKVDDAIRGAAAVMFAVKAPMSSMFDNIIKSKRDTLPHVESVIYEDGLGLVGWVAGQRILLGNRRLLEAHGIKVPSVEYEKKYTDKSKQAVYLSLGGELVAMFIVTYKGSSYIAEELRSLEQNGVTILVRTIDSNIIQDRIAEDFGVFYRSVKILPTGLGNITKEMTDTPDEETRAYIATKGGIQSFARAISGCIRIKSNVTLSIFLQMAGIILGFVLVGVITFISGIARLNILELLIMYVFCIIVGIVAPTIRKP
ncbi:uncharacterized protein BN621_00538 [Clostridium sp. CAG:352]|nr:uncharacterized protein BN621_00538 [Clostridium sp. CAG:352]